MDSAQPFRRVAGEDCAGLGPTWIPDSGKGDDSSGGRRDVVRLFGPTRYPYLLLERRGEAEPPGSPLLHSP